MFRFFIAVALLCSLSAGAQTQALDLFDSKLSFELPSGWKQVSYDKRVGAVSAEFVPADESLNQWSGLICVQSFKVDDENLQPEAFMDALAKNYTSSCQGHVSYEKLGDIDLNGHEGVHGILGCTRMPNQHQSMESTRPFFSEPEGEVGYYSVISLPGQLVLLHKSMRGEEFSSSKIPLTPANHKQFVSAIMPIKVN